MSNDEAPIDAFVKRLKQHNEEFLAELGIETITLTMDEAKRVLDWRAMMDVHNEEKHWGPDDHVLMGKLLDFVDD